MSETAKSIDRIRRARKNGPELMDDIERAKWTLDPHHSVTTPHEPGSVGPTLDGLSRPDQDMAGEYEISARMGDFENVYSEGKESARRQHSFLGDAQDEGFTVEGGYMADPRDGDQDLDDDDYNRTQAGFSRDEWQQRGLGLSSDDRLRVMSDQAIAADKAKFERGEALAKENAGRKAAFEADVARRSAEADQRLADSKAEQAADFERRREQAFEDSLNVPLPEPKPFEAPVPKPPTFGEIADKGLPKIGDPLPYEEDELAETQPDMAPLPGEERLSPEVARWNQGRASRGMGGLSGLHKAYMAEVPEDQRSQLPFEYWLEQKGVKPGMGYAEAAPILNRLAPMDAGHVSRRKDQYVETMMKRYGPELAARGITEEQIRSAYDSGNKDGDPILGGARAANNMIMKGLKNSRAQQIAVNHSRRVDQQNRARSFGVPLGAVQFFDTLQAAKTPEERFNVLMLAHRAQPGMGWDKVGAMLMKGEIDNDALDRWAQANGGAKPDAFGQIGANNAAIANGPLNAATFAQARAEVTREMPNAKPAEQRAALANKMLPSIRNHIASGQPMSIESTTIASQVLSTEPADFAYQIGLPPNDPRVPQVYQQIHGRPMSQGWLNDGLSAAGRAVGGWFGFSAPAQAAPPGTIPQSVQAWGGTVEPKPAQPDAPPSAARAPLAPRRPLV
jgi:hypothetical protein